MFFLNAGFFIGLTGGGGQNFLSQSNKWKLEEQGTAQVQKYKEKTQELKDFAWVAPIIDGFIGGEVCFGGSHIWSTSVGVGYMSLDHTIKDPRRIDFPYENAKPQGSDMPEFFASSARYGDDQYITKTSKLTVHARSLVGFRTSTSSFSLGISGLLFNMSQEYKREKEDTKAPPLSQWQWMLGPCASLKVNLGSRFRFVCYGEVLFAPSLAHGSISFKEPWPIDATNQAEFSYGLTSSFKPTLWKVTVGFELHFGKRGHDAYKTTSSCYQTSKERRIEQLRRKVLSRPRPCGYYQCRKRRR